MYWQFVIFFACLLAYFLTLIYGEVPVIACPEYFRYYSDGQRFFGKITLPTISQGNTKLEVHLSQKGVIPESNPSNLTLDVNKEETIKSFLNGQPITYHVEFPVRNVLPKLTLISLNDAVLCSDQDYPAPSTKVKLIHNLSWTIRSSRTPFGLQVKSPQVAEMVKSVPKAETPKPFAANLFLSGRFKSNKPLSEHNKFNATTRITPNSNSFKFNPNNLFLKQQQPQSEKSNDLNEVCGRLTPIMTPLIRGGETISRGQFPWLTAIYGKKVTDLKFLCGGSLISSRTVITAAHCFYESKLQENKILVLLGRNNLGVTEEVGGIDRQISSLILHPEYNLEAISDADIALMQLKTPVMFTKYISPICLWNTAADISNIVGSKAYAAGWGTDEHGVIVTERPKKIETYIADDMACKRSLKEYQTMVSLRTICVSAKDNTGPCTGDSGGGLVMYREGRWTLRAIVSAGLTQHGKCVSYDYYYFADVAKHIDWIHRNMWQ